MDSEHQQMDVDPEEAVVDAAEDGIEEKQPEGDDQPEEESEGEDEEADGDGAGADPAREQKTAATRSGRKRKPVQRLVNQSVARSSLKPVEIMEGKGVRLGDIEAVEEELQRARGTDKWLRKLHTVLFPGASVNKSTVKKNIRDFSGFVDTSAEMRQARISKLTVLSKQEMSDLATLLQQHRGGTKEDVAGRIVEFLECPQVRRLAPPCATTLYTSLNQLASCLAECSRCRPWKAQESLWQESKGVWKPSFDRLHAICPTTPVGSGSRAP